jgi:hypothetical protein
MARNQFPMMKSGGGIVSKLISFGVLITIGVLVVKYPADSASWVTGAVHGVGAVIEGFVNFVRALFGG